MHIFWLGANNKTLPLLTNIKESTESPCTRERAVSNNSVYSKAILDTS